MRAGNCQRSPPPLPSPPRRLGVRCSPWRRETSGRLCLEVGLFVRMWLWLLSSGAGEALLRAAAAAATDVRQSGAPWPTARAAAAERRCWRTGAGCCAGGDIGAGLREVCVWGGEGGALRWAVGRKGAADTPPGSWGWRLPAAAPSPQHPAPGGGPSAASPVREEQRLLPPALRRGLPLPGGRWPACFVTSEHRKRWSHRQNQSVSPVCTFCHVCLLFPFGNLWCRGSLRP